MTGGVCVLSSHYLHHALDSLDYGERVKVTVQYHAINRTAQPSIKSNQSRLLHVPYVTVLMCCGVARISTHIKAA